MAKLRKTMGTVEAAEAAFYDAIARADLQALMPLWAEDEEIVCVHPGAPRLIGHAAIRASWEAIFERGGVQIRPTHVDVVQTMMMVIHNVIEEIARNSDDQQDMHILATNVYVKTPTGWRIVVHHASIAPGLAAVDLRVTPILH